jgi:excisionase family DNA binding protein
VTHNKYPENGVLVKIQPTAQAVQKLLRPEDLARVLGVPRLQIIRQSRAGKIPAVRIGKVYRYRATTIDSWLQGQERGAVGRNIG